MYHKMQNNKKKNNKVKNTKRAEEHELAIFIREMWVDMWRGKLSDEEEAKARDFFEKNKKYGDVCTDWSGFIKKKMEFETDFELFCFMRQLTDDDARIWVQFL